MFVDYKKELYNNLDNSTITIPESLISQFNRELPEVLRYIRTDDGLLTIDPETIRSVGGLKPKLTKAQKAILGNSPSDKEIIFFADNSQQKIQMVPRKADELLINEENISIKKVVIDPYKKKKVENKDIYLLPHPFPPAKPIELGSKKYKRQVMFERIPVESLSTIKYRTVSNETLDFQITHNILRKEVSVSISTRLNNIHSVQDIVETISIYNAFHGGKGYFAGKRITDKFSEPKNSPFTSRILSFWEKVYMLETALSVTFSPTLEPIDFQTACDVERVFQGIIKNKPYLSREVVNSVTRICDLDSNIHDFIGQTSYFEFDSTVSFSFLKTKLKLPALVGMFNTKITKVANKDNEETLFFDDADNSAKRFSVVKVFADEQSRDAYMGGDHKKIMEAFSNAKSIEEYLDKQ